MSSDAHTILCKFVQVLQKVLGASRGNVGDLPRRRVLPLGGSVLDGVLGYDPVLQFHRWWQPTYQDVGRAGAVTPDVLRWTRGFCLVCRGGFRGIFCACVFFRGAWVGFCFYGISDFVLVKVMMADMKKRKDNKMT